MSGIVRVMECVHVEAVARNLRPSGSAFHQHPPKGLRRRRFPGKSQRIPNDSYGCFAFFSTVTCFQKRRAWFVMVWYEIRQNGLARSHRPHWNFPVDGMWGHDARKTCKLRGCLLFFGTLTEPSQRLRFKGVTYTYWKSCEKMLEAMYFSLLLRLKKQVHDRVQRLCECWPYRPLHSKIDEMWPVRQMLASRPLSLDDLVAYFDSSLGAVPLATWLPRVKPNTVLGFR